MLLRPSLAFVLVLLVAGCSGQKVAAPPASEAPPALLDVWAGLDEAFAGLSMRDAEACGPAFATWFADFGARGLACAAAQVVTPTSLVQRAGIEPFTRGPHTASAEQVRFDLEAPRAFGHYDPAFVEWVVENGIPGAESGVARSLTQPVYDRRIRRLARIYWLTHADLEAGGFPEATPDGPLADYAAFLTGEAVPGDSVPGYAEGGFSVFAFTERSEALLPNVGVNIDNEWTAKYEANTAYGFWLRRAADGTFDLWHGGLRRLLQTYDAAWLESV